MVRLACISLSKLRLQILLRKHPDWQGIPVAVTQEERPTSPIIQCNKLAEEKGVQIGNSYAAALALVPDLRANSIPDDELEETRSEVLDLLKDFSPEIEPCRFDLEAIWINATGMTTLFGTFEKWLEALREALRERHLWARVVVGFSRFGTYALAKAGHRSRVFDSHEDESIAIAASPVTVFPLSLRSYRTLSRLGIKTLGDFLRLPEDGAKRRFGQDTQVLVDVLKLDRKLPIQAMRIRETLSFRRKLDAPLFSVSLLMEEIETLVGKIVKHAAREVQLIESLEIHMRDEEGGVSVDIVQPARPTQNPAVFLRLIELRLLEKKLGAGVEEIEIFPSVARVIREQQDLFGPIGRDTALASEAFAVIRARFGNTAVCTAHLRDSVVPEKSFSWEPADTLPFGATEPAPAAIIETAPDLSSGPKEPASIRRLLQVKEKGSAKPGQGRTLCRPFIVSEGWYAVSNGELRVVEVESSDSKERVFEQRIVSEHPAIENLSREYDFHLSDDDEIAWAYMDCLAMSYQIQGYVD